MDTPKESIIRAIEIVLHRHPRRLTVEEISDLTLIEVQYQWPVENIKVAMPRMVDSKRVHELNKTYCLSEFSDYNQS
jgi:hypothetical protein